MPKPDGTPYWWESGDPNTESGKTFNDVGRAVNDAGQWIGDRWDNLMGARSPDQVSINQQAGQGGPAAQAGIAQAVGPDGQPQGQVRDMQMGLIQQLQDQAAGRGPSLAAAQLQQGTDRNIAQAMALSQSQRGAGAAGMLKGIQGQQAGIAQGMAGDAAMLRLSEQMAARQALGKELSGAREQDLGFAGMGQQGSQFNVGQTNQGNQFNVGQTNTMADAARARAQEASIAQAKLDMERQKLEAEAASKRSPVGMLGGVFSALSDRTAKTEISPGEGKLYAFLEKLGSHSYKYKDPKHGRGHRISPMAQEIEGSDLGEEFVFTTHEGKKAVDYGKGFGTMLASQAALHKRLRALEHADG